MSVISWAESATADLQAIRSYYNQLGPDLAATIVDRILDAAETMAAHPSIGAPTRLSRVSKWRAKRTPYLVLYKCKRSGIEVVRIRHDRTDWEAP